MENNICFHCGEAYSEKDKIVFDQKSFCCVGCKTVYQIFSENDLTSYYEIASTPGTTPREVDGKFDFLDNYSIVEKLIDFSEPPLEIVTLYVPQIHCTSCIWILENLQKLQPGIISSQVNFNKKKVRITYCTDATNLKEIVLLMAKIGYEPYISLEHYKSAKPKVDRSLIYRVGVAFFCYGNIMLLSFPEYFGIADSWLDAYKPFFRWLIFALALPSFFYSGSIYHKAAYQSLKARTFDINIPMSLGLIVMFIRSTVDIVFDLGQGFFDSLTSLIFLMLLGKLFQSKTYDFLSFERDFKSYFPVAVTKINADKSESSISVYDVQKGDRLLIRNQELIPVDAILISPIAHIDYSFVTGEADLILKKSGDKLYAGGKQLYNSIEVEVVNSISQSYLTQLWDNEIFAKKGQAVYTTMITKVSRYFTPILISIALMGLLYWLFIDFTTAFNVFTAVLIIACPCALALSTPFTLGNVIRIMGREKLYLKNTTVIEQLAKIDTIVFDKTGTITSNKDAKICYQGQELDNYTLAAIKSIVRNSNHPLSRKLYEHIQVPVMMQVDDFNELPGKGMTARVKNRNYKIGSYALVGAQKSINSEVFIEIDNQIVGKFGFSSTYRKDLNLVFESLENVGYKLQILSGDNQGEQEVLKALLTPNTKMLFNQKPDQKLAYIAQLQKEGHNVLMIGDGLNDAGALVQSNVGISISEDVNIFSPACDGILDAKKFGRIPDYLLYAKRSIKVIKVSFTLSLLYNVVGISFALSGSLSPLVAAIIMPMSTVTIVGFVTLASNYLGRKIK